MELFGHPLSSYYQKAAIAFYEADAPFTFRMLDADHAENVAALDRLSPSGRFPVFTDGDLVLSETSIIIEYVATALVAGDAAAVREIRLMDRIFDNYVMTPMQKFAADAMRGDCARDPAGVADARAMLTRIYGWLNGRLAERTWAVGEKFSMADCAAAPSLFYADWSQPVSADHGHLHSYMRRLADRPSVARARHEAEPYLHMVPVPRRNVTKGETK